MKTTNLLTVPKTGQTQREKFEAFKAAHGIETYHSQRTSRSEHPWLAMLMPDARALANEYDSKSHSLCDLYAEFCRIMHMENLCADGPTERDAVRELCSVSGIVCES